MSICESERKKRCRNCARAAGSRPSRVSINKSKYASLGRRGAGSAAPEPGVTGVDLHFRFPGGERGEMIPRLDRRASRVPLARSQELALETAFVRKTIAQIEQHCPLETWRRVPVEARNKDLG